MRVTFLGHSGFFLELPEADLLFDYYKGNLPAPDPGKPLFVFVSHVHADHFSKRIFSLAEKTEQIRYVLSDDIPKDKVPGELRAAGLVRFIGPEEDLTLPLVRTGSEKNAAGGQVKAEGPSLRVRTFPSTDEVPLGQPITIGTTVWMDRNLGASSADCENDWLDTVGYYWEFGRNIPFMVDWEIFRNNGYNVTANWKKPDGTGGGSNATRGLVCDANSRIVGH